HQDQRAEQNQAGIRQHGERIEHTELRWTGDSIAGKVLPINPTCLGQPAIQADQRIRRRSLATSNAFAWTLLLQCLLSS
ncbi:MAG TPA: hypothetical protein VGC09_01280, partial [Rhodopila sp.]